MKPPLSPGLVLLASLFSVLLFSPLVRGTPPPDPTLTGARITFANGETLTLRGRDRFRPIALAPGETATIELQLPVAFASALAVAQALDGGRLSVQGLTIAANGRATIAFQVGAAPGRYRLLLTSLGRSATLRFEVAQP